MYGSGKEGRVEEMQLLAYDYNRKAHCVDVWRSAQKMRKVISQKNSPWRK